MTSSSSPFKIAFIGGGNMASAIIGGLCRNGFSASDITVIEPFEATRQTLLAQHGIKASATPNATLQDADVIVWSVKPQILQEAAKPIAPLVKNSLHLSIAAGIPTTALARWLESQRIVRAMPNTPALVGKGMTGLFSLADVTPQDKQWIEQIAGAIGEFLWLAEESQLDAVTALSGSGPAYVFYFLEAMRTAGEQMGLSSEQAYKLATVTFSGGSALASQSEESPETLRQRVTSKGGTTYAATSRLDELAVKDAFISAIQAAQARAQSMAQEFGQ